MIINKKVNPCGFTKSNLYFKKIKIFSIFSSNGARGRTRTGTVSLPVDFESTASTNFTTRALPVYYIQYYSLLQEKNELNSINSLN